MLSTRGLPYGGLMSKFSSETMEALKVQYEHGCHLVASYVRGEEKGRCECNKAWKRNPATWRVIDEHLSNCEGAHVGIVPYSGDLTATVLDLDRGSVREVTSWCVPELIVPSMRSDRAHLWYGDVAPRRSLDWSLGSAGGEVRSGNGFVIETYHEEVPILIVERFLRAVDDLKRRDLFSLAGIEFGEQSPDAVIDVADYSGMVEGDGRNQRLFDDLRNFAKTEVRRHSDIATFEASLTQLAFRLNRLFDEPEDSKRVGSLIRSVADYSWKRKGVWMMSGLPLVDKVRGGVESGKSRRRSRDAFDAEVGMYLDRGYDVASIAVLTGRHERTIYQSQARIRAESTESNTSRAESNAESNTGIVTKSVTSKAGFPESNLSVQGETLDQTSTKPERSELPYLNERSELRQGPLEEGSFANFSELVSVMHRIEAVLTRIERKLDDEGS